MTNSDKIVVLSSIVSLILGGLVVDKFYSISAATKKKEAKEIVQTPHKVEPDWKSIEDIDLEFDMEKVGVTLIKRSFNDDGYESTSIEYIEDGKTESRYFYCSRDVHEKLVNKFREIQNKKSEW